MRVELDQDLFTSDGHEPIIALMWMFVEGRHQWHVDPDGEAQILAYFEEHSPTKALAYADLMRKSVVERGRSAPPVNEPLRVTSANLYDHVTDLNRPAKIVVENEGGDGSFIRAIAHVFEAPDLLRALKEGWLEFAYGGGGGEVPKVVHTECERFRRVPRVAFLLDSDRGTAGHSSKNEAAGRALNDLGVPGIVLKFREVENYVPTRILAAVPVSRRQHSDRDVRLRCLRELLPEQRGFVDIKHGFAKEKPGLWPPHIVADREILYSPTIRINLRDGFGERLAELLEREAAAGNVRAADFDSLGPGVCDELRALLALIEAIV